jgi:ATP-binding cassette subfamily F protein 3
MNLIQVINGTKSYGARKLFDQINVSINDEDQMGLIGPNGAGKTTFFKILVGKIELDGGQIVCKQGLKIGYLEQEANWNLELTPAEELTLHSQVPLWEHKKLGHVLDLHEAHFNTPLKSLSGGYRMRFKLLALIAEQPDLLLLDEPTNYLDLESVLTLENFLQNYKKAFMIISHDREFLKRTTSYTVEIEMGDVSKFPGHIDDYFEQKQMLQQQAEAKAENLSARRKSIESFIERFKAKATKAKQAQSRMKMLDKMETVEIKDLPIKAKIQIPAPYNTGRDVIQVMSAQIGYNPSKVLLNNVNLVIRRGDKIAVVGVNGAGKSTLLKSLGQKLAPLAGSIQLGLNVKISYFAQHVWEELHEDDTVLGSLQAAAHPDCTKQEILNIAGSLLFSGDDVYKKIKVLSGGERARVALGQCLLKKNPVLMLDEPTNHLDFDTVEALTQALENFEGTVVIVSHDRAFVRRVGLKIIEIDHGKLHFYPGTYDDYLWSQSQRLLHLEVEAILVDSSTANGKSNTNTKPTEAVADMANKKFNFKEERKKLESQLKQVIKEISNLEIRVHEKNQKMEKISLDLSNSQLQGAQIKEAQKDLQMMGKEIAEIEELLLQKMEQQIQTEEALNLLLGS